MTRSIGDADASELVISRPDITAVPYPIEGCTLAVASDGIWDFIGQVSCCSVGSHGAEKDGQARLVAPGCARGMHWPTARHRRKNNGISPSRASAPMRALPSHAYHLLPVGSGCALGRRRAEA